MTLFIFIVIIIFLLLIEINHQFRLDSPLLLKPIEYKKNISELNHKYIAWIEISNTATKMEVMIPSLKVEPHIIGVSKDELIKTKTNIKPLHPDSNDYKKDYWSAYVLKSQKSTQVQIEVEFDIENSAISKLECLWLDIELVNYGPFGVITKYYGFAIPNELKSKQMNSINTNSLEPIKTHILGSLDNPIDVLRSYLPKDYQTKDIITIGESPLAIMQGKYLDYRNIRVSQLSRYLCKGFHPTSSLATGCGMQSLINIYGPTRILISWLIGAICKSFRIKGIFYRLAGEQARLIDDITGTTPPYDKNIVLGPKNTDYFCKKASRELGLDVAVVDANDLGRVKILSTNNPNNTEIIKQALSSNPAGNSNQHTPLVLIRSEKIGRQSRSR